MKRIWLPDSLVLIFAVILAAQLCSYFLPTGEFDRELVGAAGQQREQVVPGTYHRVAAAPLPPFTFLTAIPRGMVAAGEIIFLVFIVGGAIGVIRASGALDALIGASIRRFSDNRYWLVAGMMVLFALGSSAIGMGEEYIPFVPLLVAMSVALGMDAAVGVGMVLVAAQVGFGCSALNPFTLVIAQQIAGLPLYSGQLYRWCLLAVFLTVSIHHVLRYARRVARDPSRSVVADLDLNDELSHPKELDLTRPRVFILLALAAGIGVFVYGVAAWGWFLTELSAVFLGLTVLAAAVGGVGANRAARAFGKGAAEMTMAALLIGFARSIQVVLDDAVIKDTIIDGIAGTLQGLPATVAAVGMLGVQSALNFLIPSGSGQAYVTMPIMAPLADLTGISRQLAVLAFQLGDGFMNLLVPTAPVMMGMLAMARIPFVRWVQFVAPLMIKLYAIAVTAMVVAVLIGY